MSVLDNFRRNLEGESPEPLAFILKIHPVIRENEVLGSMSGKKYYWFSGLPI